MFIVLLWTALLNQFVQCSISVCGWVCRNVYNAYWKMLPLCLTAFVRVIVHESGHTYNIIYDPDVEVNVHFPAHIKVMADMCEH